MDSMRSLNTSLPKAKAPTSTPQPSVHESFRSAALTVTQLYKSAMADLDKSRTEGYQEALEDIINYMDRQNIGHDGEGHRLRQWAMERLDGPMPDPATKDSDSEEEMAEEKRTHSSSPPPAERHSSPLSGRSSEPPNPPPEALVVDPPPNAHAPQDTSPDIEMAPPTGMFQFTSAQPYPSPNVHDGSGPDLSANTRRIMAQRRANRSSRHLQRNAQSNLFSLGGGAGQKRKLIQEYFNVDFADQRDAAGGGKRGRML